MWTDLGAWFQSAAGARILQGAVLPALAIIVAGVIAALIGRTAVRSALARAARDDAAAVVAGLVEAARTAVERDADGKDRRRRSARLRGELDVRARLLPLRGSALAADWATLRLEGLQHAGDGEGSTADLDDFRDRLIAWTQRPGRARALFAKDVDRWRAARDGRRAAADDVQADGAPRGAAQNGADPTRASTPVSTTASTDPPVPAKRRGRSTGRESGLDELPVRDPAVGTAAGDPTSASAEGSVPAGAAVMGAESSEASEAVSATPAWRRARAAADARVGQETPESDPRDVEEEEPVQTAPVAVQRSHRASGAPAADADEAVRAEAQLIARHSRSDQESARATPAATTTSASAQSPPTQTRPLQAPAASAPAEQPQQAPAAAPPVVASPAASAPVTSARQPSASPADEQRAAEPAPAPASPASSRGPLRPDPNAPKPAWLDTYDDEADVTQTMNLKTPPPVAAMSVRDRNRSGDDIVPRQ